MAALDFPDTPTVGQLYGSAGTVWRWDGARWASTAGASGQRGIIATLPTLATAVMAAPGGNVYTPITATTTVTFKAGRKYRIVCGLRAVEPSGGAAFRTFNASLSGTVIGEWYTYMQAPYVGIFAEFLYAPVADITGPLFITISSAVASQIHPNNNNSYVEDVTFDAGSLASPADPGWIPFTLAMPIGGAVGGSGADNRGWYTRIGAHTVHAIGTWAFGTGGFGQVGNYTFNLPVPPAQIPDYSVIGTGHIISGGARHICSIHKVGNTFQPWGSWGGLSSSVPAAASTADAYYMDITYPV